MIKKMKAYVDEIKDNLYPPEEWRKDYSLYYFSRKELLLALLKNLLIICVIAYSFYRSYLVLIAGIPLLFILLRNEKKKLCRTRASKLGKDFMDAIKVIASNLNAGYSIENAFKETASQLCDLYGENSDIGREFVNISRQLDLNVPLPQILGEFAERTNNPDILLFANNIRVAKQSGGNLKEIIAYSARTMGEKLEVRLAIDSMVAAKRLEQRIMSIVPIGIIVFVDFSSPGFLDVLYHNLPGIAIMTVCLFAYYMAIRLGDRILDIEM